MNSRHQTVWTTALAAAALISPAAARATDVEDKIEEIEEAIQTNSDDEMVFDWRRAPWIRLRLAGEVVPEADFGIADVTSARSSGTVKMLIPSSDHLAFRIVMRSGGAFYDFDGNRQFLDAGRTSGDPFDELIETVFSVGGRYRIDDTWAVLSRTFLTSRHEDDASFGSGIQGGGMLGASYNWRDRVGLIVGLGLGSRMTEGGVKLAPVFQARWTINDRFKLVIDGFQGHLTGKLSEAFLVSVFGGIEGKRYRLEDRGGAIGKGTIRDRREIVGLRGEWRINPRWRVRTELGSVLDQELKVEDSDGDKFDVSHSNDPAFYSSLRFEYRFGK